MNGDWGLGMGDWGLGIGDWGLGPIPNPQSPIPNPQSPIFCVFNVLKKLYFFYNYFKFNIITERNGFTKFSKNINFYFIISIFFTNYKL